MNPLIKNKKIFRLLCGLFCLLTLSGCWLSTAFTGASAVYDRYNLQERLENHGIALRIGQLIKQDPAFQKSRIVANCFHYDVLLTGQTTSENLRQKAADIAAHAAKVDHVYNFITTDNIATPQETLQDDWITTKINAQIVSIGKMDPDKVKVITEKSTVYLMAIVTPEQAEWLTNLARYTEHVKQVVKIFTYVTYSKTLQN